MGLSTDQASTIPLVLNLDTSAITPQFHVVFDDCSLQLPPVLMISQTLTLQHGPRYLETVSTNSSGMKMTPRLTKKTYLRRHHHQAIQSIKTMDNTMPPSPLPVSPPPSSPSMPSHPPSPVLSFMSPSSPPIAVSSPSIGMSPPAQPQSNRILSKVQKSFCSCTHVNSCQNHILYINLHILLNI